jgi:hypothetical protein
MSAPKKQSRFAAFRARLADRLARSSRIFFLGLVVACGIEVLVDWNQALWEVNVLRDQIRQKGQNYAGLLSSVVVEPMQRGYMGQLERLSTGILDDEDAIYVRITDADGKQIYDRMDKLYEKAYDKRGRGSFRKHYAYFLDRDMRGMATDPEGFKQRLANSRYRDLPQIWADGTARALALVIPPDPKKPGSREVVYQDRLRDESRKRDDTVTWAIAPLVKDGKRVGAVLVAFDMTRINRAAGTKYLKGLGMVVFFVGLILLQNLASRRDKLRLLDIEARHQGTKETLRAELPAAPIKHGPLVVRGVLEQARGHVDGMVWDVRTDAEPEPEIDSEPKPEIDSEPKPELEPATATEGPAMKSAASLLIVDPDGDGIDAAAVGLHTLRSFRATEAPPSQPADEVAALGKVIAAIPLARPIAILLLRLYKNGDFIGLSSDFAELRILDGKTDSKGNLIATVEPVIFESGPEQAPAPRGIVGPLYSCRGTLKKGATLVIVCAGKSDKEAPSLGESWDRRIVSSAGATAELRLEDLSRFLRQKQPVLAQNDIVVVAVRHT